MAYLLAAAIILGAVGVSFGRQMGRETQPGPATSDTTVGTTRGDHTPPAPTVASTGVPELATTWSEADLMALPADSLDAAAAATAEWYVVDFFTRDEPAGDRSFVEWVRASQVEWRSPSTAEVTVLIRRLAAVGDEPYQRLEAEAWRITTELADGGVVGGARSGASRNPRTRRAPRSRCRRVGGGVDGPGRGGVAGSASAGGGLARSLRCLPCRGA
jgi:hypothetical protein